MRLTKLRMVPRYGSVSRVTPANAMQFTLPSLAHPSMAAIVYARKRLAIPAMTSSDKGSASETPISEASIVWSARTSLSLM